MGEMNAPDEGIEVRHTKNAGWAWRCHWCDLTTTGLTHAAAHKQAEAHLETPGHWRARRG